MSKADIAIKQRLFESGERKNVHTALPHELPDRCWVAPNGDVHKLDLASFTFHMQWIEKPENRAIVGEHHYHNKPDGSLDHSKTFRNMFKSGWVRVNHPTYETHENHRGVVQAIADKRSPGKYVTGQFHSDSGAARDEVSVKGKEQEHPQELPQQLR